MSESLMSKNLTLDYDSCKQFTALNDGDTAYVCRCYDGDTLTLAWIDKSGFKVRIGCRISGIDTPEMKGSSEHEKTLAELAKKRLSDAVLNKTVTILDPGTEKYGRLLCDLSTPEINSIKEYMILDQKVCKPYSGGTKSSWN